MTKRVFIAPFIAAALLAGCSKSDELRARQKAREAGQEIKEELHDASQEAKAAGRKLKEGLQDAGKEARRGVEKAKAEARKSIPESGDADRKRR